MAEKKRKITLIKKSFNLSISFIVLSLICLYAWQMVGLMNQKYQRHSFEDIIQKLKTENQQLKVEVARLQSVNRVQNFALESAMSSVPSIVYLSFDANEIVAKK